jgi:enoyl-CoA hydratase/carnithine racemase
MNWKTLILEKREGIARITINNPEKRNCLSEQTSRELLAALEEIRNDDTVSVVTTTGAGDVSFCAGMDVHDLKRYYEHPETEAESTVLQLDETVRNFPKVTIAVVNGYCLGAAITFLVSHDLAIASEEKASFGLPEIMRGFTPKYVVGALFKAISMKFAFDMLLSGENWDARKAQAAGLVSRIAPHAKLHDTAFQWAKLIARWDPMTLEYCKKAAHASMEQTTFYGALMASALYHMEHANYNPKTQQGLRDFISKEGVKADMVAKLD